MCMPGSVFQVYSRKNRSRSGGVYPSVREYAYLLAYCLFQIIIYIIVVQVHILESYQ